MAFIVPKTSMQIINKFITFLEDNLTDPYEQAVAPTTGHTRTDFVIDGDFTIAAIFPKLQVKLVDLNNEKIATQSTTKYLEEEQHMLGLYYSNKKGQKFLFTDTNLTLVDEAQCTEYLELIKRTLKTNAESFRTFGGKMTFGTIPQPSFNPSSKLYTSILPVMLVTYRK